MSKEVLRANRTVGSPLVRDNNCETYIFQTGPENDS